MAFIPSNIVAPAAMSIPSEIVSKVFGNLGYDDTMRLASACRKFNAALKSDHVQYTRKLLDRFMLRLDRPLDVLVMGDLTNLSLTDHERAKFHAVDSALRFLRYPRSDPFRGPDFGLAFAVANGILVQAQATPQPWRNSRVLACCAPDTFGGLEGSPRSWTLLVPGTTILDLAIVPETDVLAILSMEPPTLAGVSPHFALTIRNLSDGNAHATASGRILIYHMELRANITPSETSTRLRMNAELAALRIADDRHTRGALVAIANWQTGEVVFVMFPDGGLDLGWVHENTLVVASGTAMLNCVHIVTREPLTFFISCRLCLPSIKDDVDVSLLTFTAPPSATHNGRGLPGVRSFYDSQRAADVGAQRPLLRHDERKGVCAITIGTINRLTGVPNRTYNIFFPLQFIISRVHTPQLLQFDETEIISSETLRDADAFLLIRDERFFIHEEWAEDNGRVIRSFDGHDYSDSIAGWRVLERRRVTDPYVNAGLVGQGATALPLADALVMTDFNPNWAPPGGLTGDIDTIGSSTLQGPGEWEYSARLGATIRQVWTRSVLQADTPGQHVWKEDIQSSLGYRQTLSRPQPMISYAALDESGRIWLARLHRVLNEREEPVVDARWEVWWV